VLYTPLATLCAVHHLPKQTKHVVPGGQTTVDPKKKTAILNVVTSVHRRFNELNSLLKEQQMIMKNRLEAGEDYEISFGRIGKGHDFFARTSSRPKVTKPQQSIISMYFRVQLSTPPAGSRNVFPTYQ